MANRPSTGGLAIALLIGLSGGVIAQGGSAQNGRDNRAGQYSGSEDPRQHGYDRAYRDGADRGRQDRERRAGYHPETQTSQSASRGYESGFGNKLQYNQGYREGYKVGYDDGYNGRPARSTQIEGRRPYGDSGQRAPGSEGGDYRSAPGSGAYGRGRGTEENGATRRGQNAAGTTLTVPGNRQWTATNVRVNQGETVRFEVTGEIRFTADANDRAVSAGSLAQKRVATAPIPAALAGALIGRIGNGQPFGIGNQSSITMPAGGTLYLGVNDDNVSDNTGQFQVIISR